MSIKEPATLDMSAILTHAYELGDYINASSEVANYLHWKKQLQQDGEARELIRLFAKKKDKFEECERFGHFHPDYHAAMDEVKQFTEKMNAHPVIRNYKEAEEQMDDLFFGISEAIAKSVSDTIKVPGKDLAAEGGCSSGTCGSGGCGGKCG